MLYFKMATNVYLRNTVTIQFENKVVFGMTNKHLYIKS